LLLTYRKGDLLMLTERLTTPLRIPSVWRTLLAMDELGDDVPKARISEPTKPDDQQPYRNDAREVSITEGDWTIRCMLCSGSSNYWLQFVAEGPGDAYYESEPEESLPAAGQDALTVDMEDYYLRVEFPVVIDGDTPPVSEYHVRKPLKDAIWANVDATIDGYSGLIEYLLNVLTLEQLRNVADAYRNDADGTCENCGQPCEYDSDLCLCAKCEALAVLAEAT